MIDPLSPTTDFGVTSHGSRSERLTVLSDAEQFALYGLPDFDNVQRLDYLALSEAELTLDSGRPSLHAQIYCVLQIGCFKAKHAFFRFSWDDTQDDLAFVLSRYFNGHAGLDRYVILIEEAAANLKSVLLQSFWSVT